MAAFRSQLIALATAAFAASGVKAVSETHTVSFVNNCGYGTPILQEQGVILANGGDYTTPGPIINAYVYLQTGYCGTNGANCTTFDVTLENGASSANLDLTAPRAFSVPGGFEFYNGCSGSYFCNDAHCGALNIPVVTCAADNADLLVTFC